MKDVVFDFDGVIHSYTSGWQGETIIPDEPVPGIKEALKDIFEAGYRITIVSSRCICAEGKVAIIEWLIKYDIFRYITHVTSVKVPAVAYIDDRAICFDGHPEKLLNSIENLKPWCVKSEDDEK